MFYYQQHDLQFKSNSQQFTRRNSLMNSPLLRIFAVAMMAMFLTGTAAFAQEEEKKPELNLKGKAYIEYMNQTKVQEDDKKLNTFQIKRVYLTWKKELNSIWSARVTTDVGQVDSTGETDPSGEDVETETTAYAVYLKYAYVQGKKDFGPVSARMQLGMIGTPNSGYTDKVSGYRWVNNNYSFDHAKKILAAVDGADYKAQSIDNSADAGVRLDLELMKMVTLTGMYSNGEGYKKVDEPTSNGKAMYGMLKVTPVEGLALAGFYRNEVTNEFESGDNYRMYYGAGISYSTDLIKVGANYVLPEVEKGGEKTVKDAYILDTWLNMNLNSVAGMPVLIMGRYAMAENDELKDVNDIDSKITIWAAGLGYEIARGFKALAYLENRTFEQEDVDDEQTFYVKTEVKF